MCTRLGIKFSDNDGTAKMVLPDSEDYEANDVMDELIQERDHRLSQKEHASYFPALH